jgi:Holliday junction resolvasome RuvABC ATP-dependent DNA helicase subunit
MLIIDLDVITPGEMKYKPRPALVPFFKGRQDILNRLMETHIMRPETGHEAITVSVLTGLGGSGKTQIALKIALEFETK